MIAYRKDGAPVWVELITVALRDSRGEITGYLGIHRDISERRWTEEALREAQHRNEMILESIGDQFYALDGELRFTYLNQHALAGMSRVLGKDLSLDDLLGKSVWEVLPELVGTRFDYELHRALREQQLVTFESWGSLTGSWFDVRAYPAGNGLSVYSTDISLRKQTEQLLVDARELERSRIARAAPRSDRPRCTADLGRRWTAGGPRAGVRSLSHLCYAVSRGGVTGRVAGDRSGYPVRGRTHALDEVAPDSADGVAGAGRIAGSSGRRCRTGRGSRAGRGGVLVDARVVVPARYVEGGIPGDRDLVDGVARRVREAVVGHDKDGDQARVVLVERGQLIVVVRRDGLTVGVATRRPVTGCAVFEASEQSGVE
jgi:hypothetical protein